jgi:hypothetical protein
MRYLLRCLLLVGLVVLVGCGKKAETSVKSSVKSTAPDKTPQTEKATPPKATPSETTTKPI